MDPSGFPSTLRKDVFEPETPALQGQYSTAELRAQFEYERDMIK